MAADEAHAAVLEQVGRVALGVGDPVLLPEPADVGVPEAAQAAAVADVRAVRVALLVGVGVVLAVVGDPADHRPLDGHRAEDGEQVLERPVGLERAVGEQPVVADRDPEGGGEVDADHDPDVGPADELFQSRGTAASTATKGTITAPMLALR